MTRDFGTWHAGCGNGEGSVFADGEGRMRMGPNGTTLTAICTVHDFDGERDDHVRLIAAAPELLEALEKLMNLLENVWDILPEYVSGGPDAVNAAADKAILAIVKATGRE